MEKSFLSGVFLVLLMFAGGTQLCSGEDLSWAPWIEAEKQALLKLKQSFKDPSNRLASWNGSTDCLNWVGVSCNYLTGHVYNLDLYTPHGSEGSALSGTGIDPSLLELKQLDFLDLSRNDFRGSRIPEFLGSFEYLSQLDLSEAGFRGTIPPSLGNLSSLTILDLSQNQLLGNVPESLGRLSILKSLALSDNQLNGTIPQSLGRLSALTVLDLSLNQLSGSIPSSLWHLRKLDRLDISSNSLEGIVSELNFSNLSSLTFLGIGSNNLLCKIKSNWVPHINLFWIDMSSCAMMSEFPRWLQTQTGLRFLDLSNANISGTFPTWLHRMTDLYHLDLSANQISGNLPKNIADNMPGLQTLRLRRNLFSGSVPQSLCKLPRLQVLDLSRNNLSGELPDCWKEIHELRVVILSSNNLSGTIPSSILHFYSLTQLHLGDNSLGGEIPLALRNCTNLEILDLGENRLSGIIPSWIGESLSSLRVLRFRKNMLNGSIPLQLCYRTELQILDLSLNNLSGEIPRCFNNLTRMTSQYKGPPPPPPAGESLAPDDYDSDEWDKEEITQVIKGLELEYTTTLRLLDSIDLSSNQLVGSIPEELCQLSRLRSLNLSHNHLSGEIPDKIGGFKSIESIDLSDNQLFGAIPASMSTLVSLNHLDLSYNNLSGRIPTSNQLQTLIDPSIYAGNVQLCGAPLPKKCPGDRDPAEPPTTSTVREKRDHGEDFSEKILFYFVVAIGYATGLWAVIGSLVLNRRWRVAYFRFVENAKERVFG